MGTSTPWGTSQSSEKIIPGIVFYSTAGHGGYHLTKKRVESLPAVIHLYLLQNKLIKPKGDAWLEEDCDWAFSVLAFPSEFSEERVKRAHDVARNFFPSIWEVLTGKTIMPGESYKRDKVIFAEVHKNDFIAVGAWGSWAEHVPEGMVGVVTTLGGSRKDGDEEVYWLVPDAEYQLRSRYGFIIDPSKHERLNVVLGASKPLPVKPVSPPSYVTA